MSSLGLDKGAGTLFPTTLPARAKGRPARARMEIERRESQRLLSLGYDAMGITIPHHLLDQVAQGAITQLHPDELLAINRSTPSQRNRDRDKDEGTPASREGSTMEVDDSTSYNAAANSSSPSIRLKRSAAQIAQNNFSNNGSPVKSEEVEDEEDDGEDGDESTTTTPSTPSLHPNTIRNRKARLLKAQTQLAKANAAAIARKYDLDLVPRDRDQSLPLFKTFPSDLDRESFAPHQRSSFKPSWPEQVGVDSRGKPISKRVQKDKLHVFIINAQAQAKRIIDEEIAQEKEDAANGKLDEKEDNKDDDDDDDDDGEGGGGGGKSKGKKKRKKIRHINIQPDEADRGFMITPNNPDLAKRLYQGILDRIKEFKNKNGKRLADDWEELPDPEKDEDFYERFERPTSFNLITKRVEEGDYPTAADFQLDMDQLFANARRSLSSGSPEYGDLLILQRYYQQLCTVDLLLHQNDVEDALGATLALSDPSKGYASMSLGPAHAPPGVEFPNLANRVTNTKKITYKEFYYRGLLLRPGDWCHISNPSDPHLPIIGHIFKISRREEEPVGQVWLSVCWYFRPEQTIHPSSTTFFKDEIFKTNRIGEHHVEDLLEMAFGMFYTKFTKGRPVEDWWDPSKSCYVVEHRWNEDNKSFSKIKNWNSCVPEELRNKDIPLNNFATPQPLPERVPSPFLLGVVGPGSLSNEASAAPTAMAEHARKANEQAAAFKKAQEALASGSGGSSGFLTSTLPRIPGSINAGIIGSAALTAYVPVPENPRVSESPAPGTPAPSSSLNPAKGAGNQIPPPSQQQQQQQQPINPSNPLQLQKATFTALTQDWKKVSSSQSILSTLSSEVLRIVGPKIFSQLKAYFEVPRSSSKDASLKEIVDAIKAGNPSDNPIITRTTLAGGIVSNPPPRNDGPIVEVELLARWRDALLKQNGFNPIPEVVSQYHLESGYLGEKRKQQKELREESRIAKACKRTGAEGSMKVLPEETASLFQRDPSTSMVKWFPAPPLDGPYQQKLSRTYPNSVSYLPPAIGSSASHSLEYLYQMAMRKKETNGANELQDDRMDVDV